MNKRPPPLPPPPPLSMMPSLTMIDIFSEIIYYEYHVYVIWSYRAPAASPSLPASRVRLYGSDSRHLVFAVKGCDTQAAPAHDVMFAMKSSEDKDP